MISQVLTNDGAGEDWVEGASEEAKKWRHFKFIACYGLEGIILTIFPFKRQHHSALQSLVTQSLVQAERLLVGAGIVIRGHEAGKGIAKWDSSTCRQHVEYDNPGELSDVIMEAIKVKLMAEGMY